MENTCSSATDIEDGIDWLYKELKLERPDLICGWTGIGRIGIMTVDYLRLDIARVVLSFFDRKFDLGLDFAGLNSQIKDQNEKIALLRREDPHPGDRHEPERRGAVEINSGSNRVSGKDFGIAQPDFARLVLYPTLRTTP